MKPRNHDKNSFNDNKVKGLAVEVWNNDINKALRKFKKKVQDDGILQNLREREHYTKPSEKRAKEKAAGRARWMKQVKKLQDDGIVPTNGKNRKRLY